MLSASHNNILYAVSVIEKNYSQKKQHLNSKLYDWLDTLSSCSVPIINNVAVLCKTATLVITSYIYKGEYTQKGCVEILMTFHQFCHVFAADLRKAINTDKITKAMFEEISIHEPATKDPNTAPKVPTPQFTFDI